SMSFTVKSNGGGPVGEGVGAGPARKGRAGGLSTSHAIRPSPTASTSSSTRRRGGCLRAPGGCLRVCSTMRFSPAFIWLGRLLTELCPSVNPLRAPLRGAHLPLARGRKEPRGDRRSQRGQEGGHMRITLLADDANRRSEPVRHSA